MPYHAIQDPLLLRRVLDAVLLIEADLDQSTLLRHVVEEACAMTGARYGALGVLNEDRTGLGAFVTTGMDADQVRAIGAPPTGLGVLGLLIAHPKTLRVSRIDQHPERYGFPPGHPEMTSFLGVPVKVRDEVYGNLYLTDKVGALAFTSDDQAVVEALAIAAGIAIENTRLHEQVQLLAVLGDRDRLAEDLHDTVIQHLFGVGLSLQSIANTCPEPELSSRLQEVVRDVDATIGQIRTTIYGLGLADPETGVRSVLLDVVREFEDVVGFPVDVSMIGPVEALDPGELGAQLVAVASEALSNVGRHAGATRASLTLIVTQTSCVLQIDDNGRGMGAASDHPGGGMGLVNLGLRAERLHGSLQVGPRAAGGTSVRWEVPLGDDGVSST